MEGIDEKRIADKYNEELKGQTLKLIKSYNGDIKEFLDILHANKYGYNDYALSTNFGIEMREFLKIQGNLPSQFFKNKIKKMPGYISETLIDYFYYTIDMVSQWQISMSMYRRSFRTSDYSAYTERIIKILWEYHRLSQLGGDVVSILSGKIDEKIKYFCKYHYGSVPEEIIATMLDKNLKGLKDILTDIIYDNSETLSQNIIRGIVMSHCEEMYEVLGKLLIAARLQEGLRQAICENLDIGTKEAFVYIFKIIVKNDLIRFSSVMRAIGTWTGILTLESQKLDRVSKKQICMIDQYLSNIEIRKSALNSNDSMEIYLALWSYGFSEYKDALKEAYTLAMNGNKHQRLVACYFLNNTNISESFHAISAKIVEKFAEDKQTIAMIFPNFMYDTSSDIYNVIFPNGNPYYKPKEKYNDRVYTDYSIYFKSKEETRKFYYILKDILNTVTKKKENFNELVFPWDYETLKQTDIVIRMAFCASSLHDEDLIDEMALKLDLLGDGTYDSSRANVLELLCRKPKTEVQRKVLIAALSNLESNTRKSAYRMVKDLSLTNEEYLVIEDMLKSKKSDVRNNVIDILSSRQKEDKVLMIKRLLKDTKEEKRTAALDMLKKMEDEKEIKESTVQELASSIQNPTTKEKILIDEICKIESKTLTAENGYGIYDPKADFKVELEGEFLEECKKFFIDCFPNSRAFDLRVNSKDKDNAFSTKIDSLKNRLLKISKLQNDEKNVKGREAELLKKIDDIFEKNKEVEYTDWNGNTHLLGNAFLYVGDSDGNMIHPFKELWESFYEENNCTEIELIRMHALIENVESNNVGFYEFCKPFTSELMGDEFNKDISLKRYKFVREVVCDLMRSHISNETIGKLAVAMICYFFNCKRNLVYSHVETIWDGSKVKKERTIVTFEKFKTILSRIKWLEGSFMYQYAISQKFDFDFNRTDRGSYYNYYDGILCVPDTCDYIVAYSNGIITKDFMYKSIMKQEESFTVLSYLIRFIRERGKQLSNRGNGRWLESSVKKEAENLLGHNVTNIELTKEDEKRLSVAEECYETISKVVMNVELVRGDTETEFSNRIYKLKRIYGTEYFVRILSALGSETLERSGYFNLYGGYGDKVISKKESLSHLLQVCMPDMKEETSIDEEVSKLKKLLKGTDIKDDRLIEAGMYSPEWIEIVGKYIGWEGFTSCCYYFMAHMNEYFDDKRKAMIARYTPLTSEELNDGAFDINWFREVYEEIGSKRFNTIYKAAKYISDGSKHSRARKYADAATGKLDAKKLKEEIEAKRNKDSLMAYGIIPVNNQSEYKDRYIFIQKFLKESKQFGALRRASEKKAVEMAIKNLSVAAGFLDETRFILKMEGEIATMHLSFFTPKEAEDVIVYLAAGNGGKIEIVCEKEGKKLKSIPAKLKKNEYIESLQEAKKTLSEQYRRTKKMLEEAMELESEFTYKELTEIRKNPAVTGLIDGLIFKSNNKFGFFNEFENEEDSTKLIIAHPYHMYEANVWRDLQKKIFEMQFIQPFKQVFRELYVKTADEKGTYKSLRYAGNQIQPQKTIACLKDRRWIADTENGLQKIYYKQDIIATIYALADWFSPADIEAPTIEWVVFYDRKTLKQKNIDEIPDIIFSEVMRDVDFAVSVAHAGGVDPEMSHSTIEMRRAIAEFSMTLFKIKNVTFTENHAIVEGKKGEYSIHLGSGIIHKVGGTMINVLPIHSAHRGRVFLPFVDDDPKTAEIISKIVLFAEEDKIKDPYILKQL